MGSTAHEEGDICYICLGEDQPLMRPCACRSLRVHQTCLARWQLQSAGKEEERQCRFCKHTLPNWKAAFSGVSGDAVPVMSIQFAGSTYWLEVKPGDGGVEQFKEDVRRLLGLSRDQAFDITFECRVPGAVDSKMELQGLHAYDAAVYCASLTAAQRLSRSGDDCQGKGPLWPRRRASSSSGGGGGLGAGSSASASGADSAANTPMSISSTHSSRFSMSSAGGGGGSSSSSSSLGVGSDGNSSSAASSAGDSVAAEAGGPAGRLVAGGRAPSSAEGAASAAVPAEQLEQPACARSAFCARMLAALKELFQLPDCLDRIC